MVMVDEVAAELSEQDSAGAALVEEGAIGSGQPAFPDGEEVGLGNDISPLLMLGKMKQRCSGKKLPG